MVNPTITIKTKRGDSILVDKWQAWKVLGYTWCVAQGYAQSRTSGSLGTMHRLLTGAKKGERVDHINRVTTDNRLSNLRIASHAVNMQNCKRQKTKRTYRGVEERGDQFIARIGRAPGNYIGSFATAEDAARAYDCAAKALYPGFPALNFP